MSKPNPAVEQEKGLLGGRWMVLDGRRSRHLERCRVCSEITIPSLLPKKEHDSSNDQLPTPYQSLGARAVNNLAAKLLLTLFPPNTSFFRLDPDPLSVEELKEDMGEEDFKQKIEKQLRLYERMSTMDFESKALRTKLYKVLRLLVATGNALLELKDDGTIKVYRLDKYVVRRAPDGSLKEIIIEERVMRDDLPQAVLNSPHAPKAAAKDPDAEMIPVYTGITLKGNKWQIMQESCNTVLPDSIASYPKDKLPFLALTWNLNDSENYGRGHVEEHLGDLVAFDAISQSLIEGAAAAAFMIIGVKPNGTTNVEDIRNAKNGQPIEGDLEKDLSMFRVDKAHDFRFASDYARYLADNLGRSFLLTEAVQRDAERVTAEEIRLMAQEIETGLGGIYSVLGVSLQKPLVKLLLANQTKRGKLPELPEGIETTITTGFDALGRGHDLQRLREYLSIVGELMQAVGASPQAAQMINVANYCERAATAIGLDTDGLVPSEDDIKKQQAMEQQQGMMMEGMKTGAAAQLVKGAMENPEMAQQMAEQVQGAMQ